MKPSELNARYRATLSRIIGWAEPRAYVFDPRLMCAVGSADYNAAEKTGVVFVEPGECVDMSGCIRVFEEIDPDVEVIFTMKRRARHLVRDTAYYRSGGEWMVVAPEHGWTRIFKD